MVEKKEFSDNNNYLGWAPYLATVGVSTIGGAIMGGVPGGIIGLATSIFDEYLISKDIADKHYLSNSAFWSTTVLTPAASLFTKILPSYSLPIHAASYGLSAITSYSTNDFLNFKNKIETPLESFLTINKLFDEKEIISKKEFEKIYNSFFESPAQALGFLANDIKEIYNNKFLYSFAVNNGLNILRIIVDNFFLHYLASYSGSLFISALINNHNAELTNFQNPAGKISIFSLPNILVPFKGLLAEGSKIISLYIVKNILEFIIDSKQYSLSKDQFEMVLEKSTEIIIEDGNGRKLLATDKGKEIIQNLTHDLFKLLFSGANKLNDVISESSKLLISLNNIIKYLPEAFAPYALSLFPVQLLLDKIAQDSKEVAEKLSEVRTKIWDIKSDITDNIEQINLRDGEEFAKFNYNLLLAEENNLEKKSEYNGKIQDSVGKLVEIYDRIVDVIYFGIKTFHKQLDVSQIPLIKISIDDLYSFLSSNIQFEIDNKDLIISKERIEKLFEIISAGDNNDINRTSNNENKIIFKDYVLRLDGKELVKIDNFEFMAGKHYAITGKSGCGKTSTLIDLKEGLFGALSSAGEISIGSKEGLVPKIMFIDQKLYLPKESTLLESIYFPSILKLLSANQIAELKAKVIELFKELEIDQFTNNPANEDGLISKLDSKEFKLSGGQSKKVAIIQAILNDPDILIMDETFTGLDKYSLIKAEQIINKYLPNTTILSVDHHAEDNNYNGFYDSEVHFADGGVTEKQIISKSFAIILTDQASIQEVTLSGECPKVSAFEYLNTCYS